MYKNVDFDEIEPEELPYWRQGVFGWSTALVELSNNEDGEQAVTFNSVASYLRALERIDYGSEARSGMSIDGKVPMVSTRLTSPPKGLHEDIATTQTVTAA